MKLYVSFHTEELSATVIHYHMCGMSVDLRHAPVDVATLGPTVGLYYNFNIVLHVYKKDFGGVSTSPAAVTCRFVAAVMEHSGRPVLPAAIIVHFDWLERAVLALLYTAVLAPMPQWTQKNIFPSLPHPLKLLNEK